MKHPVTPPEGLRFEIIDDTTCSVTKDGNTSGNITIPETVTINGRTYSVTTIGNCAFQGCKALTSINIPNSVTSIGNSAFYSCESLTSINIPEGVTSIGFMAFEYCKALNSINIPNSVTSIGSNAFEDCQSLASINIPEGVTSIGSMAFYGCQALTSINIPEGVTTIGYGTFGRCISLKHITLPSSINEIGAGNFSNTCVGWIEVDNIYYTITGPDTCMVVNGKSGGSDITIPPTIAVNGKSYRVTAIADQAFGIQPQIDIYNPETYSTPKITSIHIPDSVTTIGARAFCRCIELKTVNIPEGVTIIADETFYKCESLTSVNIPDSVSIIGREAFSYCKALISIDIPGSVKTIGVSAFALSSLMNVKIGEGVEIIDGYAFGGCKYLTSITLPSTITTIGSDVFNEEEWGNWSSLHPLPNLVTINCLATTPPDSESWFEEEAVIHVPQGCAEAYRAADCWQDSTIIDDLEGDEEDMEAEKSAPKVIPTAESTGLDFKINDDNTTCSVTDIDSNASGSITIPEAVTIDGRTYTVTHIGDFAFYESKGLTTINIPSTVTSIGDYAFSGCEALTSINIPEGVTSIGENLFLFCKALTTINCRAKTPPTTSYDPDFPIDVTIHVPRGCADAYLSAKYWHYSPIVDDL